MTTPTWMIKADGLHKKFSRSLNNSMRYGMQDVLRQLCFRSNSRTELRDGEFWAVEDVSFELCAGRCLGIMGVNGSGKTTLLRILNGIYAPDAGQVQIRGKVGALIAAGAGFSPLLTGRENIYINGSLLGMSYPEISRKMAEIVAFAEIDDFIDAPVRHYSSGMQVRLGFAVAAVCQPDVLLVDEALAVGDLNFQKKCYEYLHRLKKQGTAIVLVSHSVGAIWALCDEGIYLHKGKVIAAGPVEEVIRNYNDYNAEKVLDEKTPEKSGNTPGLAAGYGGMVGGTGEIVAHNTRLIHPESGCEVKAVDVQNAMLIETDIEVKKWLDNIIFRYTIDSVHYKFIGTLDSVEQGEPLRSLEPGQYCLRTLVRLPNLRPGTYFINLAICQKGFGAHLFYNFDACRFQIRHPRDKFLYSDEHAVVFINAEFSLQAKSERAAA